MRELHGAGEDYLRELHTRFRDLDLAGLDVVLDCANGATYRVAPEIFRRLGANVTVLAASPDGRNINAGCGSTHVEELARMVGEPADTRSASPSTATATACSRPTLAARSSTATSCSLSPPGTCGVPGRLPGEGVAVTVMTNYGFHQAMEREGIEVAITAVGDRYVLEALREQGWALGGEQSGHIIEMGFNHTGDGIAGALLTLEALGGAPLAERHAMEKLPQRLVNVRVRDRGAIEGAERVHDAVRDAEQELAGRGRVLIRPSGTEPLVRVMVEAPTEDEADAVCTRLVALVESELGAQ